MAVGPFILAILLGPRVMHDTGFFVGTALLVGAALVRAHAAREWRPSEWRTPAQEDSAAPGPIQ